MTGYTAITAKRLRTEGGSLASKLATEYGLLGTLTDGIDRAATTMTLTKATITLTASAALNLDGAYCQFGGATGATGRITPAAATMTMIGGSTTGDALVLQGSSADAGQKITITGASGTTLLGAIKLDGTVTLDDDGTIADASNVTTITQNTITLAGATKINLDGPTDVTGILTIDTAGSPNDGIKINATTPTDGLEIASACGSHAINISGAQTGAGITIGSTCGTYGLNISGVCATGISIGDSVKGIEIGTFATPVTVQNSDWDTAGGAYTITKAMVSGCLNEDLSDSQCVRQLWSRFKITASQTAGSGKDYYGGEMQVRPHTGSAAIELAGGTYAGVWNYWENSDSAHALTVSGGYHYGSINMVELCSTGVISGGTFAGANMTNHVDTDPASAAAFCGILINKVSGAYDWKMGIEFTDCMSGAVFKVADDQTICSDDNQSILVDISATANAGFMKVDVGGADRYIALYALKAS